MIGYITVLTEEMTQTHRVLLQWEISAGVSGCWSTDRELKKEQLAQHRRDFILRWRRFSPVWTGMETVGKRLLLLLSS